MPGGVMKMGIIGLLLCFLASVAVAESFPSLYKQYKAALEAGDREQIHILAKSAYEAGKTEYPRGEYHAIAAYNYGLALLKSDDLTSRLFQESADIFEELHGEEDARLIDPLWELGKSLAFSHQKQRALTCYARIDKVLAANGIDDPALLFTLKTDKADAYARNNDLHAGFRVLNEAEALLPRLAPHERFFAALLDLTRGKYQNALSRDEQALASFKKAVTGFEASVTEDHLMLLAARGFLIERLEEAGRGEEATEHLRKIALARVGEENIDQMPIYRRQPAYPRRAFENRWEGVVVLELTVSELGRVENAVVVESSNRVFEDAALVAARKFRYAPKIENGLPVRADGIKYTFTFNIQD